MPRSRRTLVLITFVLLGGPGLATKVLPGSPLLPPSTPRLKPETMTAPVYTPKLELLLDIRALYEVSRAAGPVSKLDVARVNVLRTSLQTLLAATELGAQEAEALQQAIRQSLGEGGRATLLAARVRMEKRAAMALASSRLARDEGLPTVAEFRLAFMIPGGQATLRTLGINARWNPFRQGVPALTVRELLAAVVR